MLITSRNNETIKRVRALTSRKARLEQGVHLIEGEKTLREAISSGVSIVDGFVEEGNTHWERLLLDCGANVYQVTRSVMESITDAKTPQGVCAAVRTPSLSVPDVYPAGLIVALECVQDPGNVGTIIRTADAMGAVGVLLSEGCADPYAPKTMRSAMGSTYHLPIWQGEIETELQCLHNDGFVCICGHLQGESVLPHPKDRCVVVIGNEGNGVGEQTAALCWKYRLPMYGRAESLNASVAAGILVYELAKLMREP